MIFARMSRVTIEVGSSTVGLDEQMIPVYVEERGQGRVFLLDIARNIRAWPSLAPFPPNAAEVTRHTGRDCRYPVDRDVTPQVVPSVWVPAIPAGTTSQELNFNSIAFSSGPFPAFTSTGATKARQGLPRNALANCR